MRKKSVLLGFAASGAIVLGTFAATLPANAAPLSSSTARTHGSASADSVSPASKGSILCNDDICLQRITSVVNGKATVEAWADTTSFTGDFNLSGTGYDETSPTQKWVAGGAGHDFTGVPAEGGLLLQAWNTSNQDSEGVIEFAVN